MTDLQNAIWIEKYRPTNIDDLILESKALLCKYLDTPLAMPSLIFHSSKPGTGKTSSARIIASVLDCDTLTLNSSLDRGIDSIRDRVNSFARASSSNPLAKRLIHFDEADGLTKQAQESLRNLMEEFSDNCVFVFTANDLSKIIEPIRSRCQVISFENPNKAAIEVYLADICEKESVDISDDDLTTLINSCYPDMRSMINRLQMLKHGAKSVTQDFEDFLKAIKTKKVKEIYDIVYSGSFDYLGFNKWFFHKIYQDFEQYDLSACASVVKCLAETEKAVSLNCNLEIVFISNILEIMKVLK